jgi:hypothetical protein
MARIYVQALFCKESPRWVYCDQQYSKKFAPGVRRDRTLTLCGEMQGLTEALAFTETFTMKQAMKTAQEKEQDVLVYFRDNQMIGFTLPETIAAAQDLHTVYTLDMHDATAQQLRQIACSSKAKPLV